jgi:hypothetical protein
MVYNQLKYKHRFEISVRDTPSPGPRYPESRVRDTPSVSTGACPQYPEPIHRKDSLRALHRCRTSGHAGNLVGMTQYIQLDMFSVSTVDPPWQDNKDAMEYPFLSLQKGRSKPITYSKNNIRLSVAADIRYSIASVWDWDLIIFAASHLNDAIEAGLVPSPRIQFVPYDCLHQIGRSTGGKDYRELAQAIRRLRMTTVITNIRYEDNAGDERPFSWLSDYRIPKRYGRASMSRRPPTGNPIRAGHGKSSFRYGSTIRSCGGGIFSPYIRPTFSSPVGWSGGYTAWPVKQCLTKRISRRSTSAWKRCSSTRAVPGRSGSSLSTSVRWSKRNRCRNTESRSITTTSTNW